ncbi:MAG: hypothetical protein M1816_003826 [Peltula sp. TS41687]|nr:MAG: hypothetical protein M1816_003826 [Peltula sp. TS41687]
MAWRTANKPPSPPASILSKVLPLLVVFVILAVLSFIGFQVYSIINNIAGTTNKKLEKKHVVVTRDGMKVGVEEVGNEKEVDKARGVFVRAFNLSTKGQQKESKKRWVYAGSKS